MGQNRPNSLLYRIGCNIYDQAHPIAKFTPKGPSGEEVKIKYVIDHQNIMGSSEGGSVEVEMIQAGPSSTISRRQGDRF